MVTSICRRQIVYDSVLALTHVLTLTKHSASRSSSRTLCSFYFLPLLGRLRVDSGRTFRGINHSASCAMAWGPRRQFPPPGLDAF